MKTRRIVIAVGAALAAVAVVGGVIRAAPWRSADSTVQQLTYTVQRGPLTISVSESGTIKSREQQILKCEVEGQTTIIYLIPEGEFVQPGELLVELDASQLEDRRVDQQIQVQNAEAAYIQARENLEVVKSQATSDISKAELDYKFAEEDVKQYLEGEFPKQLKELESNITLAQEELERATEKLRWSETLNKEKYLSQTELDADRIAKKRAELTHELAVAERDLLQNFTYQRTLDQLNSDVDQARMALERVRLKANADTIQAEAEFKAKELGYQQQQDKLAKIEDQIAKTKIYAPIAGMVIYATSAQGARPWSNDQPLDEGRVVREREELIYLPTADAMTAEIKIYESNLQKVRPGMEARVTIDALPGRVFSGKVATIAPLPDAQSLWMNPDLKIYTTQIHLDGGGEGLRTGMSCRAEIIVEQYKDVVYVPIQSVLRVNGEPMVYVPQGQEIVRRPVELGLDNNRMVRILRGLQAGEEVLMRPPLSSGAAPLEQQTTEDEPGSSPRQPAAPSEPGARPDSGDSPGTAGRGQGEGRPSGQGGTRGGTDSGGGPGGGGGPGRGGRM